MRIRSGWRTQERSLKPVEPHSLPLPPHQVRDPTPTYRCCNPATQLRGPSLGAKCGDNPLWKRSPLSLGFFFGKEFSLCSYLVQNTELISSVMQLRENGKSYLSASSSLPNQMRSPTLLILVLLEQRRLLKETFSLFLILVGFPQARVLILLFLSDLTTSHDSPCWWLSRMTSSSNLLHPAALWHNLGNSASHLCL